MIEALAGTGKTYTAGVLRELYENAGYEVIGVAPTGRAARELTEQAGIPSRTLDRLLIDIDQLGDALPQRVRGRVRRGGHGSDAHERAAARGGRACGGEGDRDRRPGPARLGPGRRLAARGRPRARCAAADRGDAPARPGGAPRARRAARRASRSRYLDWATAAGRIETFNDAAGACEQAVGEWARRGRRGRGRAGGDDRPRQRHPRRASTSARASCAATTARSARSAPTAPGARGRRPGDLPAQRRAARRRQRHARAPSATSTTIAS